MRDYEQETGKASDQKSDSFAAFRGRWVEQGLRDHALSDGAFRVLASLAYDFLNRKKRTCWPSQETLAEALGMPVRTVQRHLSTLRSRGHLRVIRRGPDLSSIYQPAFFDSQKWRVMMMSEHAKICTMIRQNLHDDPPNPASKTRHGRRITLIDDPVEEHRQAPIAPADSDHTGHSRDARLRASPDSVGYSVGLSINIPDIGQCTVIRRGSTIATSLAGEEFKIGLLLIKSSSGVKFACPVVMEGGQEALRPHLAKRWDKMTDEPQKGQMGPVGGKSCNSLISFGSPRLRFSHFRFGSAVTLWPRPQKCSGPSKARPLTDTGGQWRRCASPTSLPPASLAAKPRVRLASFSRRSKANCCGWRSITQRRAVPDDHHRHHHHRQGHRGARSGPQRAGRASGRGCRVRSRTHKRD
ncbi:helix-turn-helix domain-containing protein [Pseudaminobacter arsenicus]|uniref:Helix-turn-helix domain-containing protein n=1 Tax=Borborobacter arsenicus TaxID=1851146 RepID=A0A432V029_9HYPH|nr:helix-turn-helix domain-containing protein [Pseudaminobacter arsenicus]